MEVTQELEAALCAPNWHISLTHVHNAVQALTTAQAQAAAQEQRIKELETETTRLRNELTLAANRLDVCVVDAIADGEHRRSVGYKDWAEHTRAALGEQQ